MLGSPIARTTSFRVDQLFLGADQLFLGVDQLFSLADRWEAPSGPESKFRRKTGSNDVVFGPFTSVDDSRQVQPNGWFRGHPHRTLHCDLWRPANPAKAAPLVVYSHGYLSSKREGLYLARFLASHGYNVVAPDFPLTGMRAPGGPLFADIVNQPGDISHIIDYLLERNNDRADLLYNTIAEDQIAVIGLSLGAMTSMMATFHRDLMDPRIAASIFIAGPTTMFTPKFFRTRTVPTLLIYGDQDSMVIYDDHAHRAQKMIPESTLLTLKNASHTGFSQPGSRAMRFFSNPDSIGCKMVNFHLGDAAWKDTNYEEFLGGKSAGVVNPGHLRPLTSPLVSKTMRANRQHMFTSLAAHAFLDSTFGGTRYERDRAKRYLTRTLADENKSEVSVIS